MVTTTGHRSSQVKDTPRPFRLHKDGLVILRRAIRISPRALREAKRQARYVGRIFNHTDAGHPNDRKRGQKTFQTDTVSEAATLVRDVRTALKDAVPMSSAHTVGPALVLHSKPGCQRQAAHCDYEPAADLLTCPDDDIPLLTVVALEPDTHLDVWPGAIRHVGRKLPITTTTKIHRVQLDLGPGDVVVFRGDLPHAGSAYPDRANTRLHFHR